MMAPPGSPAESLIGHTIGAYRIESLVGAGGMGEVYLGVHPQIGSRVAVKVLTQKSLQEPSLIERFFVEAKAVNAINHENIVNILDLSTLPDGRPYIVMEYLEGSSLMAVIDALGPLPLGSLARAACEVLDALQEAHKKGIIHRDLKPDNIILTRRGRAKVLDFGTAKLMPSIDMTQVQTQTGHVLGTPSYMAPEQILPDKPIDARTDIYAMGALLYHASTGRKPFDAQFLYDVLRMQLREMPQPPTQLRPDMPLAYEQIIMRAMAKESEQRFQSAFEMGEALNQAVVSLIGRAWDPLSAAPDERHITLAPGQRLSAQQPAAMPPPRGAVTSGPYPVAMPPGSGQHAQHSGPHQLHRPGHPAGHRPAPQGSRNVRTAIIAIVAALIGAVLMAVLIGDDGSTPAVESDAGSASIARDTGDADTAVRTAVADAGAAQGRDTTVTAKPGASNADLELAVALLGPRDARRFDPVEFLPTAEELAKKTFKDAELTSMTASSVSPSGVVDLGSGKDARVIYTYQSPSRADGDEPCLFRLSMSWDGEAEAASVHVNSVPATSADACSQPTIRPLSCSLAEVMEKAIDNGAPQDRAAKVELWAKKSGRAPRWDVDVGSAFRKTITDRCR